MFSKHRCEQGFGCYQGQHINDRYEGLGVYHSPRATRYEGEFKDGMFHGKGTLFFTGGGRYVATWDKGQAMDGTYVYEDGLIGNMNTDMLTGWRYCNKIHDRRFYAEILHGLRPAGRSLMTSDGDEFGHPHQEIPGHCYDVGQGYLDPGKQSVFTYSKKSPANKGYPTNSFLKSVTDEEHMWIVKYCRKGGRGTVGSMKISDYNFAKSLIRRAGRNAMEKNGTSKTQQTKNLVGSPLSKSQLETLDIADERIREMIIQFGNIPNAEHKKPEKIQSWSRYFK